MSVRTVCICAVQPPFVRGGAEIQLDCLAQELEKRGYRVATVALPFIWTPTRDILKNCLMWRWIELERCTHESIDLAICTKFPTYAVQHPRKVTWLVHQFRQAYELHGTPHSAFTNRPEDQMIRQAITQFDNTMLAESRAIFTESQRVADRLQRFNGVKGTALYHPPQYWDRLYHSGYGDYFLAVARLVPEKRIDLLLRALAQPGMTGRAVVVGDGPERMPLLATAERLGLNGRVEFKGECWDQELIDLFAGARAIYFAPFEEDYGLVGVEALRSRKPVVTATDSGGVLEFVSHDQTGLVVDPDPAAIAEALSQLQHDAATCARLGAAGHERVAFITWDHVIESLVNA